MSEYLKMVDTLKKRYKIAASSTDWLGLPLTIFRTGGKEEPPILVTAGAFGVEVAGVYAALELIVQVDIERCVYILPSRDPTGLQDASYVLSKMLGDKIEVNTTLDVVNTLREEGAEIIIDDSEIFLAALKGVGIAVSNFLDAYDATEIIRNKLEKGGYGESLDGMRILVVSQMPEIEGVGVSGRFNTIFVHENKILTYEALSFDIIPEISFLKTFIEGQEFGMVIDLHEGKTPAFYIAMSENPTSSEYTLLYLVLDQVRSYGLNLASLEMLNTLKLEAVDEGAGYGKGICGLADHLSPKSYAFAFTTSLREPLELRVKTLLTATLSALNAYAVARL
ncbi:MAG: hypothetical protein NZ954_08005 [Thermofilaceae archaeon]|nr:hypothetical protein [Thermofilaceae archaeon]MCX8180232.1 hypothetical protein [Thermofilaceae archaeon]MDW8003623.1 hypothetical protein [Thermofilaceae archaeon]